MTQEPPPVNVGEPDDSESARAEGQGHGQLAEGEAGEEVSAKDVADERTDAGDHHPASDKVGELDDAADDATVIQAQTDGEAATGMESASSAESADDSLDSILLEAGAKPLQPRPDKSIGSRTLMGMGIEGLNLASFRGENKDAAEEIRDNLGDEPTQIHGDLDTVAAALRAAGVHSAPELEMDLDENDSAGEKKSAARADADTPALVEAKLTSQPHADEPKTSLLEEVAQALNVQAAEYRDRARGRLPGMPATPSGGPGNMAAAPSQAEFEDPDDEEGTSLTPGVISVVEDEEGIAFEGGAASHRSDDDGVHDQTEKVPSGPTPSMLAAPPGLGASGRSASRVDDSGTEISSGDRPGSAALAASAALAGSAALAASAGSPASAASDRPDGRVDSRPTVKMPPVPGMSVGSGPQPVGPPPGVSRPVTPVSGLSLSTSGRVRLPTPGPGVSGRITLPPGTMNPLVGRGKGDLSDTMPATPISIEASRRNTSAVPIGRGSGRVSTRGNSRVTEPVIHKHGHGHARGHDHPSSLSGVLTAHVKLATVNLAGLIALTFAGGLFVGMLVWRGQGRGESATGSARPSTAAATPAAATEPKATTGGDNNAVPAAAVGAAAAAALTTTASGAPVPAQPAAGQSPPAKEAIIAPLPPSAAADDSAAATAASPGRKAATATAARTVVRPRRPTAPAGGVSATATDLPAGASPPIGAPVPPAKAGPVTPSKTPALRTAALTVSKPMANNAGAKPGTKSKAKPAWHDPFAD